MCRCKGGEGVCLLVAVCTKARRVCLKPYTCNANTNPNTHTEPALVCPLSCRAPLQILALGYLLSPATRHPSWWWLPPVLSAALIALASLEAVSRPHLGYRGMVRHALLAVAGGTAGGLVYCLLVVLPRWRSQQVCGGQVWSGDCRQGSQVLGRMATHHFTSGNCKWLQLEKKPPVSA